MKTLYFVRHGEAAYNVLDRVNAHPQAANNLTATGREQARCCALALREHPIELIVASDFPRARQTAEIIRGDSPIELAVDSRINETGAFAFEGQPARRWHEANVPDRLSAVIPGCETFADMKRRLRGFLDGLQGRPQRHIAIVSHEEPIQVMVGLLRGLEDGHALRQPISHCLPIVETWIKVD